jgi:hypothetical protein
MKQKIKYTLLMFFLTNISVITQGQTIKSISPTSAKHGENVELFIYTSGTKFITNRPLVVQISGGGIVYDSEISKDSVYVINDTTLKVFFTIANDIIPSKYTVYVYPEPSASKMISLSQGFTVNNKYGGIPGLKYATPRSVRLGDTADVMFIFKYVDLTEWQNVDLAFSLHIGLTDTTPQIKVLAYSVVNDTTLTARLFVNPNCHIGGHTLMLGSSNSFPLREYTALYVNPNVTEPHIDSVYPELVFPGDTVNLLIKTKNIVIDTTAWLGLFVERVNTLTGTLRLGGQAMLLDSNTIQIKIIIPMNAKNSDCDLYLYYNKKLLKEYARLIVQSQNQTSVGVLSTDLNNEFTLYPNPVNDILYIKSTKKVNALKIINLIGQVNIVSIENVIKQTDGISIDVKSLNLTSGVYYLYLSAGEEFIYRRIIIE